jgi:DnaJ-domain-containing protein 1
VAHSIGGLELAMGIAGLLVLWLWQAAHLLPVSFQDLGAVVVMLWIVLAGNRIYRSTRAKRETAAASKRAEQEATAERRWQAAIQRDAERRREQVEQEREAGRRKWQREEAVRRASGTNTGWWNVLELLPNASKDDIVRSYRRKIQQYHPDRVWGLGPELIELAESRTKTLNAAYAQAIRGRSF